MRGDHSGRIDIDQNPCNPAINIHLAPGQQSPGISIFDALGNLVQSFPVTIPPPVSLSSAVILAPNTPTRNTIQPTTDANVGLTILDHSLTQTAALFQLGGISPAPNAIFYLTSPSLSRQGLILNLPTAGSSFISCNDSGLGSTVFGVNPTGNGFIVNIQGYNAADILQQNIKASGQSADSLQITDNNFNPLWRVSSTEQIIFAGLSSASNPKSQAIIDHGFLDNTDASWKGRGLLVGVDSAGSREAMRWEGDGTAARVGFLGANAIVRPGANVDLRQSLINLGLYTTGGVTPLNLNGGSFQASTISDLVRDAATSITTQMILLTHQSTGTPLAGFGSHIEFALDDNANVNRRGGKVSVEWVTPTSGSTVSSTTLHAAKGNSFVPCLVADGNQQVTIPGNFFHNGIVGTNQIGFFQVGPVGQQANASQTAITAVLDANAKSALQAIYNLLKNYGLAPATA